MKLKLFIAFFSVYGILSCLPREKSNILTFDATKDTTFVITKYYNPLIMKIEIDAEVDGEPILLLNDDKLIDTFKIFQGKKKYSLEFYHKKAEFQYKKINVNKGKISLNIKLN